LVNSTHRNDVVKIADSCAHCTQRIAITIEKGQVKELSPPATLVFYGGG